MALGQPEARAQALGITAGVPLEREQESALPEDFPGHRQLEQVLQEALLSLC